MIQIVADLRFTKNQNGEVIIDDIYEEVGCHYDEDTEEFQMMVRWIETKVVVTIHFKEDEVIPLCVCH